MSSTPEPAPAPRAELPAAPDHSLGVALNGDGADFAAHAPHATAVDLCLLTTDADGAVVDETRIGMHGPSRGLWSAHVPGVGPHLQGATHPVLSILRSHGQGDDLAVGLLGQGDGGLDGVLVELVEDILLSAHESTVLDATLGLHVGNVLDADHDSHGLKVAITAASHH